MRSRSLAVLAVWGVACTFQARASLVFDITYDSTVATSFGANTLAFENTFQAAADAFSAQFTDNIHINITVSGSPGTSILGESSSTILGETWAGIHTAAANDAKSADDNTAVGASGSITAADPSGGADHWWVTRAEAKALGLIGDDLSNDGNITIGAGFTYDFNPNDGITSGAIDLQGVDMHEISEVMGRIGISGGSVGGFPSLTLLDALSYQ